MAFWSIKCIGFEFLTDWSMIFQFKSVYPEFVNEQQKFVVRFWFSFDTKWFQSNMFYCNLQFFQYSKFLVNMWSNEVKQNDLSQSIWNWELLVYIHRLSLEDLNWKAQDHILVNVIFSSNHCHLKMDWATELCLVLNGRFFIIVYGSAFIVLLDMKV